MGAILAGTLAPNGVTFTALEKWFNLDPNYVPLIGGIGLIFNAIKNPEGLAGAFSLAAAQIRHLIGRRSAKAPPDAGVPVTAASAGGS